mmetsp:Transcript_18045/g.51480  ORF Transcript_18045/g.51480 Transcript_18045/m.51480 type:complete len:234 (+) Transcript_18045:556-1257(+)
MMATASLGKLPPAVSPLSMTASAPSNTALATSEHSARVGLGLLVMDSSICVATITGLPWALQIWIIFFCSLKTRSGGISMPRSPRATMTASVSRQMLSKFSRPSWFSIFEMILTRLPPPSSRTLRIVRTSSALCTKDAATKSTGCLHANSSRSRVSFSWSTGRSTTTPGRFMFLRSPIAQSFKTVQATSVSFMMDETSSTNDPSAQRICEPGLTLDDSFLYVQPSFSPVDLWS